MSEYVLSDEDKALLQKMERADYESDLALERKLAAMTPEEKAQYLEDAVHMSLKMGSSIPVKDPG